jgi:peptidoglycan/xylan/chitin deacetylase (PgdA/CDA1 family)
MVQRSGGRRILYSTATLAVLGVLLLPAAWRLHKSRTIQTFGELVTRVSTADSVVALTFDDGPAAPYTDSILDLLQVHRVPATFFVTGESMQRHPELARKMVEQRHELGNHSFSHRRMVLRSQREIRYEVETTDSLIQAAGATGRIHFRPPYGKRLVGLPWYLSRTNRATILWTIEPDSWYRSADDMTRHVLENVSPGSIILLHVELPSRVEERAALPRIIEGLQKRGYEFVTVSQLMTRAVD